MFENLASKVISKLPSRRVGTNAINKVDQNGFHFSDHSEPVRGWSSVQSVHALTTPMPVGYTLQLVVYFSDGAAAVFTDAQSIWHEVTTEIHAHLGSTPYPSWSVQLIANPATPIELYNRPACR